MSHKVYYDFNGLMQETVLYDTKAEFIQELLKLPEVYDADSYARLQKLKTVLQEELQERSYIKQVDFPNLYGPVLKVFEDVPDALDELRGCIGFIDHIHPSRRVVYKEK